MSSSSETEASILKPCCRNPECVKRTQSGPQASVWFFALTGTFLPSECRNGMPTASMGMGPRHLKTAVDVEKMADRKRSQGSRIW